MKKPEYKVWLERTSESRYPDIYEIDRFTIASKL